MLSLHSSGFLTEGRSHHYFPKQTRKLTFKRHSANPTYQLGFSKWKMPRHDTASLECQRESVLRYHIHFIGENKKHFFLTYHSASPAGLTIRNPDLNSSRKIASPGRQLCKGSVVLCIPSESFVPSQILLFVTLKYPSSTQIGAQSQYKDSHWTPWILNEAEAALCSVWIQVQYEQQEFIFLY